MRASTTTPDPEHALDRLQEQLDGAYRETAGRLDANVALEIQRIAGMDRPDLSALERLDEPAELSELRGDIEALLPDRVSFSEILLEVCHWTSFADAFTHLSEGRARVEDLHVSVCAVLLAEACNISLLLSAVQDRHEMTPSRRSRSGRRRSTGAWASACLW